MSDPRHHARERCGDEGTRPPLAVNDSPPKTVDGDPAASPHGGRAAWRWRALGGAVPVLLVGLGLTGYGTRAVRQAERATQAAELRQIAPVRSGPFVSG